MRIILLLVMMGALWTVTEAYEMFDADSLPLAGRAPFYAAGLFVIGWQIYIAFIWSPKKRQSKAIVCPGTGSNPSGHITVWDGVVALSATCHYCGVDSTVEPDHDQVWVISAHLVQDKIR